MPTESKLLKQCTLSNDVLINNVLSKYNIIDPKVEQIKVKNTDKARAVFKITDANNNCYCLKKVYYNEGQLLFIYSALEWLYRYDILVPRFLPTKDNNRYVYYLHMLFTLTPWIDGEKCSYDDTSNVLDASKNLAKLHKATKKFKPIPGSIIKKGYENIYISTSKHFNKLLTLNNLAFQYNDKFSKLFLDSFEKNISLAQFSEELASSINIDNLTKSVCHGDYVNKNIIIHENSKSDLCVIDFDKCSLDYVAHDISYYLRRLLKRDNTKWNAHLALDSLKAYTDIVPLTIDDFKYILVYLSFPQKYWRISKDYYNNIQKCNKNSFYLLLNKAVSKTDYQLQFVDEFMKLLKDELNIKI